MSATLVFASTDYIPDFKIRNISVKSYMLDMIAISKFFPPACVLKLTDPETDENRYIRITVSKDEEDQSTVVNMQIVKEENWIVMLAHESNLYKLMSPLYPMSVIIGNGEIWNGEYPNRWYFIFSNSGKGITSKDQFSMDLYYNDPNYPENVWKFKEHLFTILDDHPIRYAILPFSENTLYNRFCLPGKANLYMGKELIDFIDKYEERFIIKCDGNTYFGLSPVYNPENPMKLPKTEDSFYELVEKNPMLQSGSVAEVAYDPDSLAKDDRYKLIYVVIKKNSSLAQ